MLQKSAEDPFAFATGPEWRGAPRADIEKDLQGTTFKDAPKPKQGKQAALWRVSRLIADKGSQAHKNWMCLCQKAKGKVCGYKGTYKQASGTSNLWNGHVKSKHADLYERITHEENSSRQAEIARQHGGHNGGWYSTNTAAITRLKHKILFVLVVIYTCIHPNVTTTAIFKQWTQSMSPTFAAATPNLHRKIVNFVYSYLHTSQDRRCKLHICLRSKRTMV